MSVRKAGKAPTAAWSTLRQCSVYLTAPVLSDKARSVSNFIVAFVLSVGLVTTVPNRPVQSTAACMDVAKPALVSASPVGPANSAKNDSATLGNIFALNVNVIYLLIVFPFSH